METEGREAQPGTALVFAREQYQDPGPCRKQHRTAWVWFHHLCSQIRRNPLGRTDCREALPDLHHVEGGDVLHRNGEYWHRRRERRRFQTRWRRLALGLLFWSAAVVCGCRAPDLPGLYSDAMSKYRDGDSDSALKLVENGNRESENRDAVWNWKFKILKAQILRRKHAAEQSAALLSTAVPPNLPADVRAQKRIVEAIALCHIGKMGQKDLLEEAGGLITPAEYSLRAQLAYAR